MAVRCVFFTPGRTESCQVLRLAGASPVVRQTREMLEGRYCRGGRFIACPIFNRVERGLYEVNRARSHLARAAPHPSGAEQVPAGSSVTLSA